MATTRHKGCLHEVMHLPMTSTVRYYSLIAIILTTYLLPTPTHPQGYTFLGWSTNAEGTNFVTEINETFEGALYAIWQQQGGVGTSVDQVVLTPENAQMYDLLGRPVGQNYKGIVIQNGKKYLLK